MSKILQMQSVPILNITDYYRHFDVLDILRNKEAFGRFAKGHFQWNGSINLHHLDVILAMIDPEASFQMTCAQDYWKLHSIHMKDRDALQEHEQQDKKDALPEHEQQDKKDALPEHEQQDKKDALQEYERQARIAEAIYKKYSSELKDGDSRILMLTIAGVLLAERDESCLKQISGEQLKKAYEGMEENSFTGTGKKEAVAEILLTDQKGTVTLHVFDGIYRFLSDPSLKPSYEKRMQTYMIRTDADVTLEIADLTTGAAKQRKLSEGEQIYCLALEGKILRILPDRVVNGKNTMTRKKDGIYINGVKRQEIPLDVSSFAVSADEENPQYIYVEQGHIHYGNYDNFNGRGRVPEEIAVISEVSMKGSMAKILRNDGKSWDGRKFC